MTENKRRVHIASSNNYPLTIVGSSPDRNRVRTRAANFDPDWTRPQRVLRKPMSGYLRISGQNPSGYAHITGHRPKNG